MNLDGTLLLSLDAHNHVDDYSGTLGGVLSLAKYIEQEGIADLLSSSVCMCILNQESDRCVTDGIFCSEFSKL